MKAKVYTRMGDNGTTILKNGERVSKTDERVKAMGAVDELSSNIGLLLVYVQNITVKDVLVAVQRDLFHLGAELTDPKKPTITKQHVANLEDIIDAWAESLQPITGFILPGGSKLSARCHVARCVARRAERACCKVEALRNNSSLVVAYLNRLSDLLFTAARYLQTGEDITV